MIEFPLNLVCVIVSRDTIMYINVNVTIINLNSIASKSLLKRVTILKTRISEEKDKSFKV